MGFRDLHAFNLAMLSKQAWRFTQDIHSLFYRVCKAGYFPNRSFMMAELARSNPSFVWRSLLVARDIIYARSQWRVGDGRDIGVFTHKWLLHTPAPLCEGALDIQVKELTDEDSRQWDQGKLETMFT